MVLNRQPQMDPGALKSCRDCKNKTPTCKAYLPQFRFHCPLQQQQQLGVRLFNDFRLMPLGFSLDANIFFSLYRSVLCGYFGILCDLFASNNDV